MADTDAHPAIVVADAGRERTQAVVTGISPAHLDAHLAGRQIDLVVEHDDVGERKLVEILRLGDGSSGVVHVGLRLEQQHALAAERAFRRHGLKTPPPRTDAVAACNGVDRHEADVVAIAGVARTRIAESDQEQHGSSRAQAHFFSVFSVGAGAAGAAPGAAAGAAAPSTGAAPGTAVAAAAAAAAAASAAARISSA